MTDLFICPVCGKKLLQHQNSMRCAGGHSFDIARQGYVNLLLAGGGQHGDDKAMLQARRNFLGAGYYAPLKDALCSLLQGRVLDAGCGEGYYSRAFAQKHEVLAVDISKNAAALCAQGAPQSLSCAVAGVNSLPVASGCINTAVSVFAPLCLPELKRVLAPKGRLLVAYPLPEHLLSLKAAVYDVPRKNPPQKLALQGFKLAENKEIRTAFTLKSNADIKALFTMTPYYYRTPLQFAARLDSLKALDCTLEVGIAVYMAD